MKHSVLLVGAGGSLGVPLVEEFTKHLTSFARVSILTQKEKAWKFEEAKTEGFEITLGSILEAKSYEGFDTVVSLVGNSAMCLQPAMIDLSIQAGVKQFVPSEWNSDISQDELANLRYFRDKFVTRDHLRARAREYPDFGYTFFITGIFTEWAVGALYGVDVVEHHMKTYGRPDAVIGVTSIPDICKYTVEALLLSNQGSQEREVRVCGESLRWGELIDALGKAQGAEYTREYLDPAEALREQEQARRLKDVQAEMLWSIKPLAASGFGRVPGRTDNHLFSFKPETAFETFQRLHGGTSKA